MRFYMDHWTDHWVDHYIKYIWRSADQKATHGTGYD